jgi:hypothetical protein
MHDIEISKYERKFKIPCKYQFSDKIRYNIAISKITLSHFWVFLPSGLDA